MPQGLTITCSKNYTTLWKLLKEAANHIMEVFYIFKRPISPDGSSAQGTMLYDISKKKNEIFVTKSIYMLDRK